MSLTLSDGELKRIRRYVLRLEPEPPRLRAIREQSERHRQRHGRDCTVYPSSPITGRFLQACIHLLGAKHVLEVGCGLGYSAGWMAQAVPPGGRVETVENVPEHAALAQSNFRALDLRHIRIHVGDAQTVLRGLRGSYDLIFDDATHSEPPRWLTHVARLLRPGGLAVFANTFPVQSYILGQTDWPRRTLVGSHRYLQAVFAERRLFAFVQPLTWTLLAVRLPSKR